MNWIPCDFLGVKTRHIIYRIIYGNLTQKRSNISIEYFVFVFSVFVSFYAQLNRSIYSLILPMNDLIRTFILFLFSGLIDICSVVIFVCFSQFFIDSNMNTVQQMISFYFIFGSIIFASLVLARENQYRRIFPDYDNDLSLWIDEAQVKRFSGKLIENFY